MKLLEHEAKQLLAKFHVPVPHSEIVTNDKTISLPVPFVLKSQVLTGGRGKAGGIVVIESKDDIESTVQKLFSLPIKNLLPKVLLAEEKLTIKRELYVSLLIDRSASAIKLLAHTNGGIEVEENKDFKSWVINSESNFEAIGQGLADYYHLPNQTFALQDMLERLYKCFVTNDATLLEINPLTLTTDNTLVAGDCKMTLDDAASFRHDWKFEQTPAEANFVTIDPKGNIATIANGAGLAMATVDAAYEAGLTPANFLDIGGGANTETLLKAFKRIVEYPDLQAIVINIFAGITRSDEVARAIIAAKEQIDTLPPLFIRLAGTNEEAAAELLQEAKIATLPNLESCLSAAREAIHG